MCCLLKDAFLHLGLYTSGGEDVVNVGGHKGLDLHVLLLLEQLLHHLHVTVLGISHQNKVSCQALLHSALGVLADPLKVRTNLNRKTTVSCILLYFGKSHTIKLKLGYSFFVDWDVTCLICHRHVSKSLDGSQLHRQCGCRLSHTLHQNVFYGRVNSLHCISHVTNNLDRIA